MLSFFLLRRTTFLSLAGINETAIDASPNIPDGLDLWPTLLHMGEVEGGAVGTGDQQVGPRTEVLIADDVLRVGDFKVRSR